ncbi:phosphatase PAP2 family protein [Streptomyces sp. NPDC002285]
MSERTHPKERSGRQPANGHTPEPLRNAPRVWGREHSSHLAGSALLHGDTSVTAANLCHGAVYFTAAAAFLVWLCIHRPGPCLWTQWVLAPATGAVLMLHLTFTPAPPRTPAAAHLTYTGQAWGPTVYRAQPETDSMADQFAAVPSPHLGWALMVAILLILATRSHWRRLRLQHPLLTLVVIVSTASHYRPDAAVAALPLPGPGAGR